MAAKLFLNESTVVSATTTTTVYTVPGDKASRVRILFMLMDGSIQFEIGSPGTEKMIKIRDQGQSNPDSWSGILYNTTNDEAKLEDEALLTRDNGLADMDGDAADADYVVNEWGREYILATGDTVKFRNTGGAFTDVLVQVKGVEDDA